MAARRGALQLLTRGGSVPQPSPLTTGSRWRVSEPEALSAIGAVVMNCYLVTCVVVAVMCSCLLGYDIGIMAGAKIFIRQDIPMSSLGEGVLIGSLNLVAGVGGLVSGKVCDMIGRRATIAIACAIFIVGAVMMSVAQQYATLLLGRVVTGLGVGAGLCVAPVYTAELAPPSIRGALVSLNEVTVPPGLAFGAVVLPPRPICCCCPPRYT